MKKRLLSILLGIMMIMSLIPTVALATTLTPIDTIEILNADITPIAGEKAGDHMAYELPADCHYTPIVSGWWDIFNLRIMEDDDVFQAGGLYCACWTLVADPDYEFTDDAGLTINGSVENVDTEYSYLDTTGEEPLFIISAIGVFAEEIPATTYSLTTSVSGGHGAISESKSGLAENTIETVTFTPDEGYEIDKVTINGEEAKVQNNALNITMDSDKTVVATYKLISTNPKTGDENNMILWIILLVVSGGVLAYGKKRSRQ
ncbi:MAG: sortase B protein-sorting domain-containing protein [Lachnospiraceae bacterium]|nr:sortase B protein-sorting domain-containing protein [Lachnospiraceae bacterium]